MIGDRGNSVSASEAKDIESKKNIGYPKKYCCPISIQNGCPKLMDDPVIASDGNTYERECIQHWFMHAFTSPLDSGYHMTRELTPNHSLKAEIEEYKKSLQINTPCSPALGNQEYKAEYAEYKDAVTVTAFGTFASAATSPTAVVTPERRSNTR